MLVQPIIYNQSIKSLPKATKTQNRYSIEKSANPTFKAKYLSIEEIQKRLLAKGITTDFQNKQYGANCVYKIVNIFERLFGKNMFPQVIEFAPLEKHFYGVYNAYLYNGKFHDNIRYNSDITRFDTPFDIRFESLKDHPSKAEEILSNITITKPNLLSPRRDLPLSVRLSNFKLPKLPNHFSTSHPAHLFVHELGHCAHLKHIAERYGIEESFNRWEYLRKTALPDPVMNLIARYKISSYGVQKEGLLYEFVAEKLSQDVCNCLSYFGWKLNKYPDVKYENIFERKWNNKYSCPEAYIDYYMQKIWNGDIDGADVVVKDISCFLEREGKKSKREIGTKKDQLKRRAVLTADTVLTENRSQVIKNKVTSVKKLSTLYDNTVNKIKSRLTGISNVLMDYTDEFFDRLSALKPSFKAPEFNFYSEPSYEYDGPSFLSRMFDSLSNIKDSIIKNLSLLRKSIYMTDEEKNEFICDFFQNLQDNLNRKAKTEEPIIYEHSSFKLPDFSGIFSSISEKICSLTEESQETYESYKTETKKAKSKITSFFDGLFENTPSSESQKEKRELWY